MMTTKNILVGVSGGVDSAVTALLLQRAGYAVHGVWLKLAGQAAASHERAMAVCDKLSVPLHVLDVEQDFKARVQDYFVREYLSGRTPNPCAVCNRHLKFASVLRLADELDIQDIATGHYATMEHHKGGVRLLRGSDPSRDQSYYLFNVSTEQLARCHFPLADMDKPTIRKIAAEAGVPVADAPDSQDICFLSGGQTYKDYLISMLPQTGATLTSGNFVDTSGRILGTHDGIAFYTVGQRKGLRLDAGGPWFVREIRCESNEVVVGKDEELFALGLVCKDPNWIGWQPDGDFTADVMIRYRHKPVAANISFIDDQTLSVRFHTPQRAVAPGQAAVFYDGNRVLGGGWIESPILQ